jgi:hypothetical protein
MTGDNAKAEANVSTEAPTVDAAVAPVVWVLESGFVFGWVVFVWFKWCIKLAQVPHGSRQLDIICVDTPSGEVAEKSSSYDLSIFSSRADSQGAEIVAIASGGSSSSIRELWPDIDKLDEI